MVGVRGVLWYFVVVGDVLVVWFFYYCVLYGMDLCLGCFNYCFFGCFDVEVILVEVIVCWFLCCFYFVWCFGGYFVLKGEFIFLGLLLLVIVK